MPTPAILSPLSGRACISEVSLFFAPAQPTSLAFFFFSLGRCHKEVPVAASPATPVLLLGDWWMSPWAGMTTTLRYHTTAEYHGDAGL